MIARPRAEQVLRVRRVGLIGDVHTEHERLRHALEQLSRMQLDCILCTGDLPDGPNDAKAVEACCALLERHGVLVISGNHDRWLQDGEMRDLPGATDKDELSAEALAYLDSLPATRDFETPIGRTLLCHGMGENDMAAIQPYDHGHALEDNQALQALLRQDRYRYVISGHTHRPIVRVVGSLTVINAGTLLREQSPCWSVVDFEARHVRYFDIGTDEAPSSEWPL